MVREKDSQRFALQIVVLKKSYSYIFFNIQRFAVQIIIKNEAIKWKDRFLHMLKHLKE